MAVTLNASTSSGLVQTADTSGIIELQNNGTTKLTVNSSGATIPTATVTTLNTPTGVLATQNGMTGIAKAWVMFNGQSTVSIYGSFNVSSITDNGTGDYTINFTTAMPNINYSVVASASNTGVYSGVSAQVNSTSSGGNLTSTPTTTTTRLVVSQPNVGYVDSAYVAASIFSS